MLCPKLSLFPGLLLERDNSEEFLKREARASQLAEEDRSQCHLQSPRGSGKRRPRSEEEKYTAVVRGERELHSPQQVKAI